jgi:bifunctional non-homologous end joining protein LigD
LQCCLYRVVLRTHSLGLFGNIVSLFGNDLRREPIEKRKELLARLLRGSHLSIVLNEHFKKDGAIVFREACKLGCEGVVSKRLGSPYRSGRSPHWVKAKNPNAPAVKREAEEDWGRWYISPETNEATLLKILCRS